MIIDEEMVELSVLEKIYIELNCNIRDLVEFAELDEVKKMVREHNLA